MPGLKASLNHSGLINAEKFTKVEREIIPLKQTIQILMVTSGKFVRS